MAAPFIFIGTHTIKEGKLEDLKRTFLPELLELVEAKEPRLLAFNAYLNEEGTEVSVVQVHPDADSMLFHMQVVRDHISQSYEGYLEDTTSIQVFGPPTDPALEMIRQLAPSGVPLSVKAQHIGGFTRLQAG